MTLTAPPDPRASLRDDSEALPAGATVGRYVIVSVLGRGGMSTVYRAEDPELRRHVALKILRADLACHLGARERFAHEGHAMARLAHAHVATVFDVGHDGAHAYLALELLEGGTLGAWMRTPRRWQDVHRMMSACARGLAAAHAAGIVHRDFKPDNVLLTLDGSPRVSDFGLAGAWGATLPESADGGPRVTATGTVLGTPAYMAPEQRAGHVADARADQYSLCLVWLEALGRDRATPASEAGDARGPRWLVRALVRGLDDQPGRRWPSIEHLLRAQSGAQRRRRVGGAVATVVAAVVAVGLVLAAQRDRAATAPRQAAQPTVLEVQKPTDGPWRTRLASDGRTRVVGSSDRTRAWLEDSGTAIREPLALPPGTISVRSDAFPGMSRHGEVVLVRMEDKSVWRTGRGVERPVLLRAPGNGPVCLDPSETKVAINEKRHDGPIEIRSVDDGRVLATAPTGDLCTWAGERLVLGWRPHTGEIPLRVIEPDGRSWDLPPLTGELGDLTSDGTDLWIAHSILDIEFETGRIVKVPLARPWAPQVVAVGRNTKFGPLTLTDRGLYSARVSEIRSLMIVSLSAAGGRSMSLDTGAAIDGAAVWTGDDEFAYVRNGRLLQHQLASGAVDVIAASSGAVLARSGDEVLMRSVAGAHGAGCPVVAVSRAGVRTLLPAGCVEKLSMHCDRVGRCALMQVTGGSYTFSHLDPRTGARSAPVLSLPLTASPHVDLADDGRWLVEAEGALAVLDLRRDTRVSIDADLDVDDAVWGHDGTYVIAVGRRAGSFQVVRIELTGATTTVLESSKSPYQMPRLSPDGQHLLVRLLDRPFEHVLFPR